MELTQLAGTGGCGGSTCPNIYLSDRGTIVVQGARVSDATIDIPANEVLAEIPTSLLKDLLSSGKLG